MGDKTGGKLILKQTSREEDVWLFVAAGGCRLDAGSRSLCSVAGGKYLK